MLNVDQFVKAPMFDYRKFSFIYHDDVIKWKHFPRYWPFVRGTRRSPVNSPHKGQWRGALMFSLICAWTNGGVNNRDAGDLKRHRTHYDVAVMDQYKWQPITCWASNSDIADITRHLLMSLVMTKSQDCSQLDSMDMDVVRSNNEINPSKNISR